MGKKGSWISAIKKAFSSNTKDKTTIVHVEKKDTREKKKWAFGNTTKGEINSLIPIYREPSSVEKILGDADRETGTDHEPYRVQPYQSPRNRRRYVEQERDRYLTNTNQSGSNNRRSVEQERDRYHTDSYQSSSNNRRSVENERDRYRTEMYQSSYNNRRSVEHERNNNHNRVHQKNLSRVDGMTEQNVELQYNLVQESPKIQLDSKWVHPPRRKIKRNVAHASAIKIQTAFRGYMARRNYRALKGLIRLQIMMRGESVKYQTMNTMKHMQILVKVQSQIRTRRLEMMENRDYNAIKVSNKDTDNIFGLWNTQTNTRLDDSWNESVLTKEEAERRMRKKLEAVMKRERALAYAYSHQLLKTTPATASAILSDLHSGTSQWYWNPVPDEPNPNRYQTNLKPKLKLPIQTQLEPISSKPKLKLPIQTQFDSLISSNPKFKPKPNPNFSIKDDESLTSCPPFSVPNYMAPTVSAKAKIKSRALEKQNEKKRFNLGQSIFGKGHFWKDLGQSEKEIERRIKHRSSLSIGSGFSIDSAVSMPVVVGRRPFK
ncbi:hypothetical protein LUZ60_001980 [Juncus effusus]|nr:hypothetical protein LUZ60_001980 [Juncus effusus]